MIWIDATSPSVLPFFKSIIAQFDHYKFVWTVGQHSEVIALTRLLHIPAKVVWRHPDLQGLRRYKEALTRFLLLSVEVPFFNIAWGFANFYVTLVARERKKPSLIFTDNDSLYYVSDRFITFKLSDRIVCPVAISDESLEKLGVNTSKVVKFDGYKEDVYIADYVPDSHFHEKLPVRDYVLVRPEARFAIYVKEGRSIVRGLVKALIGKGHRVVYLPRVKADLDLVRNLNVYVPERPLYGLDLCWHARCVMTGSGTLAREAARLGVPAASFFPGNLLSVDSALVREGAILHSRDIERLARFASVCEREVRGLNLPNAKRVRRELVKIIGQLMDELAS